MMWTLGLLHSMVFCNSQYLIGIALDREDDMIF